MNYYVIENIKSLSCEAFGIPEPTISWEWNNENLDSFEITEDGLSILTKENVAVSDSGVYTCVAVSIAGQARHDIMATVYRAPTIEIIGEDGDVDLTGTSKVRDFISWGKIKRLTFKSKQFKDSEFLRNYHSWAMLFYWIRFDFE